MGGLVVTVNVSVENEIFARGIEASLREDPALSVIDVEVSGPIADVTIVTPVTYRSVGSVGAVLVCTDEPFEMSGVPVAGLLPLRDLRPIQLLPAVRAAAAGLQVGLPMDRPARLDDRSLAVLRLLADGAGTREISHELGFSERTIKGVISNVVTDLGARSRAQAVAVAMREALI